MCICLQEAYSVARQFNLIPPVAEQAEYHMFQREKVELQMPELYNKIGTTHVLMHFQLLFIGYIICCGILNKKTSVVLSSILLILNHLKNVALRKSGTFMPHKYQDLRVKAKHYINAYLDIGTETVPYNYVLPLTVFDIPNVY